MISGSFRAFDRRPSASSTVDQKKRVDEISSLEITQVPVPPGGGGSSDVINEKEKEPLLDWEHFNYDSNP